MARSKIKVGAIKDVSGKLTSRLVISTKVILPSKSLFFLQKSHPHFNQNRLMDAVHTRGSMSSKKKMPCWWE